MERLIQKLELSIIISKNYPFNSSAEYVELGRTHRHLIKPILHQHANLQQAAKNSGDKNLGMSKNFGHLLHHSMCLLRFFIENQYEWYLLTLSIHYKQLLNYKQHLITSNN